MIANILINNILDRLFRYVARLAANKVIQGSSLSKNEYVVN